MSRPDENPMNGKEWTPESGGTPAEERSSNSPAEPEPPKEEEASEPQRHGLSRLLIAVLVALILVGAHVGWLMAMSTGDAPRTLTSRYHALFEHDSLWFENIVRRGYGSPVPPVPFKAFEVSNVAFFPGYPMAASGVTRLLGTDTRTGLLVTAQLAAWLFWAYALAFLLSWRTPFWLALIGIAVIIAHPAAMFLVAAYSESFFLAGLLGFLFWSSRRGMASSGLAVLHGFGMTATRFAGVPCTLAALFTARGERGRERAIILIVASLLGAVLFFVFCHARFGQWDFYFQTLRIGWGIDFQPLAPFESGVYSKLMPRWNSPREMSEFSVAITPWLFLAVSLAELYAVRRAGRATGISVRLPFYFCAVVIFYLAVAETASVRFDSMIRYQFCTHALLVLPMLHLLTQVPLRTIWGRAILIAAALGFIGVGIWLQIYYAEIFTKGGWFA